jgi:hypothetical protein
MMTHRIARDRERSIGCLRPPTQLGLGPTRPMEQGAGVATATTLATATMALRP